MKKRISHRSDPSGLGPPIWKFLRVLQLSTFVLGVGLIVLSALILPPEDDSSKDLVSMTPAISFFIAGFFFLTSENIIRKKVVRNFIGIRMNALESKYKKGVRWFEYENYESMEKLKVLPDDMGFLVIDDEDSTLIMEGVLNRYEIRFERIKCCEVIKLNKFNGLLLEAEVSPKPLKIVFKAGSFWEDFWNYLLSRKKYRFHSELSHKLQQVAAGNVR